jgi:hypothetical protein
MTGIVYSLIKDKPNTYWSKRTGNTEFSNFINDDSMNNFKGKDWNIKSLIEYKTHEERRNILHHKILPYPFLRLTTFIRQMKYVMNYKSIG